MTDRDSEYVNRAGLFVAGRGSGAEHGLYFFSGQDATWSGILLARVDQLAALCWHPTLPIIYGLSGLRRGTLLAWDVSAAAHGTVMQLASLDSGGDIPCDLAVDPTGGTLVAANFGFDDVGGSLAAWRLDERGVPVGEAAVTDLGGGSGVVAGNQDRAHPHQIVFHEEGLSVPDYGADLVRQFTLANGELIAGQNSVAPPGSAPRHLCFLGEGPRAVASGELTGSILSGSVDADAWVSVPASSHTGPARGRHPVNYPGDIKLGVGVAYLANRGYETIAAFAIDGDTPRMLAEVDSGTRWPQHLLVDGNHLLVAGWDGGEVRILPLTDGVPGLARALFECPGAGWLLAGRLN